MLGSIDSIDNIHVNTVCEIGLCNNYMTYTMELEKDIAITVYASIDIYACIEHSA